MLALLLLSPVARAVTLASAHYRIVGANANGGGVTALVSTAPPPVRTIGALGASAGQSEALGISGSPVTLRTVVPGFWPLVHVLPIDADADAIPAYRDNCPFAFNPTQSDVGGILSLAPDGVGDVCQCGDVNNDAIVDSLDVGVYRGALSAQLALTPSGLSKCGVISGPPQCTIRDVTVISRALAPVPYLPGIDQSCDAANP